jgi:drug/metabolite transporter (DMT)-like permease
MQIARNQSLAYIAFGAFCLLSAMRDVLSEVIFKQPGYEVSPIFVLFVFSILTQVVAAAGMALGRPLQSERNILFGRRKELLFLNLFTMLAFVFYFLAISTPLGASLNSFIDYSASPIFTAVVAAAVLHERLDMTFASSATALIVSIIFVAWPRLYGVDVSGLWVLGLVLSLLSSLASGVYRVYFKILLMEGASKSSIIFFRLFGITLSLGIILTVRPSLVRFDLLPKIALLGIIGFTVPLFLTLTIIQHVSVRSFAILLFLLPTLTFLLATSVGYSRFYPSDIGAAAIAVLAVLFHEARGHKAALLGSHNQKSR